MELDESLHQKLFSLIQPLLKDKGIDLIDLQLLSEGTRKIFDISIDTDVGITADECAKASRSISLLMDVEDPFSFKYDLEVGSPGMFRELRRDQQLKKYLNQRVKVHSKNGEDQGKEFIGELSSFDDKEVILIVEGQKETFFRDKISINLFPNL